ncbi:MAG: hypothetical protein IPK74_18290 [Deltaproteobacteria bacterium]|nr:hypothetical protein [Deltaproteobacteria bacterium]
MLELVASVLGMLLRPTRSGRPKVPSSPAARAQLLGRLILVGGQRCVLLGRRITGWIVEHRPRDAGVEVVELELVPLGVVAQVRDAQQQRHRDRAEGGRGVQRPIGAVARHRRQYLARDLQHHEPQLRRLVQPQHAPVLGRERHGRSAGRPELGDVVLDTVEHQAPVEAGRQSDRAATHEGRAGDRWRHRQHEVAAVTMTDTQRAAPVDRGLLQHGATQREHDARRIPSGCGARGHGLTVRPR